MKSSALICISLILLTLLTGCSPDTTQIEQIRKHQELTIVTRNGPATYYEGPFGPTGLEYELARQFADYLGVRLAIITRSEPAEMYRLLADGKADIAAAGLAITTAEKKFLRFGPGYLDVTPQLVYRPQSGNRKPEKVADIIGMKMLVAADSPHIKTLQNLRNRHPELIWQESSEHSTEELMQQVWSQTIDYTVAGATEIKFKQHFYPGLAVAFALDKSSQVGWALYKGTDHTLLNAVQAFFARIERDGSLKTLINRYFERARPLDYVDTQTFMRDMNNRLPDYLEDFKKSARKYALDWRLLAAVSYQESHWNPQAISPTGVRGLMMLTSDTAELIGIENRRDPAQSIYGGAKYLRYMIDKIPARIMEPDRTWMALAAYNVGYGHLEDARKIAQGRGGDPDKWIDVKNSLPLLSQEKWYSRTRHGYARGNEPVAYVSNIRSYLDLLVWHDESTTPPDASPPAL